MATSTPTPEGDAPVKKTRNRKAAPSKSVDDLLASFAPAVTAETSAAEAARTAAVETIKAEGAEFARRLASLATGSKDSDNVKGSLVALATALKRAEKAVASIPDEVFAPVAEDTSDIVA